MAMPRRQHMITDWDDVPVVMDLTMAARVLGCSVEGVRLWCVAGKLPAAKIGVEWRITKQALMRHLGLEV